MIAECAKNSELKGIDLRQMDAETLDFPDTTFDFVFCGFALFFLPNLRRALSEFKRVLKPGGTCAVSIWGKQPPLKEWVSEQIKQCGVTKSLRANDLRNTAALRMALQDAQFNDIRIIEETTPITDSGHVNSAISDKHHLPVKHSTARLFYRPALTQ